MDTKREKEEERIICVNGNQETKKRVDN